MTMAEQRAGIRKEALLRRLKAKVKQLEGECRVLADLASDTPRFYNPLHVAQAKAIRDRWLT